MKKKTKCPVCENDFIKRHGNQIYCSAGCKIDQKAASQQKLYGIIKEFRRGYLANYKLFEQLLPKSGTKSFPLYEARSWGFSDQSYYGTSRDIDEKTWYSVNNYCFAITKKGETILLTLTKI